MIDITGLEMLLRINENFDVLGIKLHLCEVKEEVMQQLQATDLIVSLTGSIFFTTDEAMKALVDRA